MRLPLLLLTPPTLAARRFGGSALFLGSDRGTIYSWFTIKNHVRGFTKIREVKPPGEHECRERSAWRVRISKKEAYSDFFAKSDDQLSAADKQIGHRSAD